MLVNFQKLCNNSLKNSVSASKYQVDISVDSEQQHFNRISNVTECMFGIDHLGDLCASTERKSLGFSWFDPHCHHQFLLSLLSIENSS